MNHSTPPRKILLVVTGLSPQVVTETVYALAVNTTPAWLPDEIHLLTTSEGADRARLTLLKAGWFQKLIRDYDLEGPRFDENAIHMLADADGCELSDIRTPDDNRVAADSITDWVRRLTTDPDSELHVSIAGGRKTMGFYAGYALSLYGRSQDRLSHVLVGAQYESNPRFFYPTPYTEIINAADDPKKPLDSRNAIVTLAEIPFVRLRHGLQPEFLASACSFGDAVGSAQRNLGAPELRIDTGDGQITAGGREINLRPVEKAFYLWLVRRASKGMAPLACPKDGAPEPAYAQALLQQYKRVLGDAGDDGRTAAALALGMEKNFFERRKSAVNKTFREQLGIAAEPYLIQRFGRRPFWTHGLALPASAIHISGDAGRL